MASLNHRGNALAYHSVFTCSGWESAHFFDLRLSPLAYENASEDSSRFFAEQEFSVLQKGTNSLRVRAISIDEEALGLESNIHQARNVLLIRRFCGAQRHAVCADLSPMVHTKGF